MNREEQNRMIARAIVRDIKSYVDANRETFNRFLKERDSERLLPQRAERSGYAQKP